MDAERARRDGAFGLERMPAIAVAIQDVVEEIHDTRQSAEDREGRQRAQHRRRHEQLHAEQQSGEDQQIFGPLARAQRVEQVQSEGASRYAADRSIGNRYRGRSAARHLARETASGPSRLTKPWPMPRNSGRLRSQSRTSRTRSAAS